MGKTRVSRALAAILAIVGIVAVAGPALARHRLSFVPGRHGYARASHHGGYHPHGYATRGRRYAAPSRSRGAQAGADEGVATPPPPGSGFKMEDGVLTYPAPARFQPKNLKHLGN